MSLLAISTELPVLKEMNLTAAQGKVTALVGPSGGGKSTILNLILRLYDPESGMVQIDGQDISQVSSTSLRSAIAYVSQDTFLFAGTISENIAMGFEGASKAAIKEAARAAHADEFILRIPRRI